MKYLATPAFVAALYLLMAFVFWELDAGQWSSHHRYFLAFFGFIGAAINTALFYNDIEGRKDE